MREIQELQVELPTPPGGRHVLVGGSRRLVAILVGVLGGFCCAVILSTLLAHPASAAVLPGAQGTVPIAAIHDTVQSTVSTVSTASAAPALAGDAVTPSIGSLVTAVIPQAALALHTGLGALQPGVGSLTQTPGSMVGATAESVSAVVMPHVTSLVSVVRPGGELGSPTTLVPLVPPAPIAPSPPVPVVPTGTASDSSSPVLGSNPLAGHRPSDLLIPTTLSVPAFRGLSRDSGILLDLRHSPPG